MLRHIVLLKWIDGTTAEQVAEVTAALDALPPQIDAIARYTHGPDLALAEGRYDYAVVGDFADADADAWRTYDTHPVHEKTRAEVIVPLVSQRASVQFELR